MKRSRWLAAAAGALLAIVAGAPAASAQGSNGLQWKDCALVPDIVVQCAAQTVPLDYDRPSGKTSTSPWRASRPRTRRTGSVR